MIQDQLLIFILSSVCGMIFTAIGVPMLINTMRFVRTAVRVKARVVGYKQIEGAKPDGPGTFVYQHPQVEFEDQQGNKRCCTLSMGGDRQRYPEGSFVKVLFDPEDPCDVRIKSLSDLWKFPIMFTLGRIFSFGVAMGVWF